MAAGDGLISMKPSSIAFSGTSATINSDGGVDFSAVTSLSLNGVFTSAYDNYLIVFGPSVLTSGDQAQYIRLRSAGTDASGSNYAFQFVQASSTVITGSRSTSQTEGRINNASATARSGDHLHVYGPALAQPTAIRTVGVNGVSSAVLFDFAITHSLSTSYDGFTIYTAASSITGTVHVFGYEE